MPISFSHLNSEQFEELVYDLLDELGFQNLEWRRGGADDACDIACERATMTPFGHARRTRWAVECKHHQKGIGVGEISDAVEWAEARRFDHLVLVVSSYLTAPCRRWLDEKEDRVALAIHRVEGADLGRLLQGRDALLHKHRFSLDDGLVGDLRTVWERHGLLPEPPVATELLQSAIFNGGTPSELAFGLLALFARDDDTEKWLYEDERYRGLVEEMTVVACRRLVEAAVEDSETALIEPRAAQSTQVGGAHGICPILHICTTGDVQLTVERQRVRALYALLEFRAPEGAHEPLLPGLEERYALEIVLPRTRELQPIIRLRKGDPLAMRSESSNRLVAAWGYDSW